MLQKGDIINMKENALFNFIKKQIEAYEKMGASNLAMFKTVGEPEKASGLVPVEGGWKFAGADKEPLKESPLLSQETGLMLIARMNYAENLGGLIKHTVHNFFVKEDAKWEMSLKDWTISIKEVEKPAINTNLLNASIDRNIKLEKAN